MPVLRPACWTALVMAAMSPSGCGLIEKTTNVPVQAVLWVMPGTKDVPLDPAVLQVDIQRYADDFSSRTVAAIDEYALRLGTNDARTQALRWKIGLVTSVVSIASGPNPIAGLIDLVAVTTIMRSALEDWVKTPDGAALQAWLDSSRLLEADVWKLAEAFLIPEQQQELRDAIRSWQGSNPIPPIGFFARPQDLALVVRQTAEKTKKTGGIFSLVGLDPTAALDPAVREVARTRLFAERAMFVLQRMPYILRGQIELLADQLTRGPKVEKALTDASQLAESVDRISRATESASQTAAQLPDRITAEREAILAAFEAQEGKLRDLSAEMGRMLSAGEKMSTSLDTTITTFDALMKRFGVGEPKRDAAPDPGAKPFDVLDYARTAEQVAAMAKELDVLIKDAASTLDSPALNKRFEDLGAVAERATADARSLVNHIFILGGGLILLAFACALAYRWLAPRAAKARSGVASVGQTGR